MLELEGKIALVTGAAQGIGEQEALLMASLGAKVVVCDLGVNTAGDGKVEYAATNTVEKIKALGGQAVAVTLDVTDFHATQQVIATVVHQFGHIDIVVNNAGILRDKMIFNLTEEDWDKVIAVHLKGTFNLTHHICKYWRNAAKAGKPITGRIVNTSSDAGLIGNPGQSNYAAAKAGIAAFTIVVAQEMARYGVRVNAIAPLARTRLTTQATPEMAPLMESSNNDVFDRFNPQNIAMLVAYLSSPRCQLNGEILRVVGDQIQLLRGWHDVYKMDNEQQPWNLATLSNAIETQLLPNIPPQNTMMQVFAELV